MMIIIAMPRATRSPGREGGGAARGARRGDGDHSSLSSLPKPISSTTSLSWARAPPTPERSRRCRSRRQGFLRRIESSSETSRVPYEWVGPRKLPARSYISIYTYTLIYTCMYIYIYIYYSVNWLKKAARRGSRVSSGMRQRPSGDAPYAGSGLACSA